MGPAAPFAGGGSAAAAPGVQNVAQAGSAAGPAPQSTLFSQNSAAGPSQQSPTSAQSGAAGGPAQASPTPTTQIGQYRQYADAPSAGASQVAASVSSGSDATDPFGPTPPQADGASPPVASAGLVQNTIGGLEESNSQVSSQNKVLHPGDPGAGRRCFWWKPCPAWRVGGIHTPLAAKRAGALESSWQSSTGTVVSCKQAGRWQEGMAGLRWDISGWDLTVPSEHV